MVKHLRIVMRRLNIAGIKITPQVLALISEIDEFKGAWRVLGQLPPDILTSLKRVATIENIGSSIRIDHLGDHLIIFQLPDRSVYFP